MSLQALSLVYPFKLPEYRFDLWSTLPLDIQTSAADNLGYNETLWNTPGISSEELKSYFALDDAGKQGASDLGFNEEEWDCWMNHYDDYDWAELIEEGVVQYFEILGWNETSWIGDISTYPESDEKFWSELSVDEQQAAAGICYMEGTWDLLDLASFDIPGVYRYELPVYRYIPWTSLPVDIQTIAGDSLGYNESSWNIPGTNSEELKAYSTLSDVGQAGAEALNFTEEEWDCWVNHYDDYDWSELEAEAVVQFFETLGWNETNWIGDNATLPDSEGKFWAELSEEEQEAAASLCYFESTWDEEDISTVDIPDIIVVFDTLTYRFDLPVYRYDLWSTLPPDIQAIAESNLGYNESSWNQPGTNLEELTAYSDLDDLGKAGAEALNFTVEEWDCWVNHYDGYDWSDLIAEGVVVFFETLGWNESNWVGDSSTYPESDDKFWSELFVVEQQAAASICYFEGTWDLLPLTEITIPDITVEQPAVDPTPAPSLPPTDPPIDPTPAPVEPPTDPPIDPTPAPVEPPTDPPIDPTPAPVEPPTDPPIDPTPAPVEPPTDPPIDPTPAPAEPPTVPPTNPTPQPALPTGPPTDPTPPPVAPPTSSASRAYSTICWTLLNVCWAAFLAI